MSGRRVLEVLRKDLRLGPRSPVFLWVLVLPLMITLVLQVVFGSLFDPRPRLGVVDLGASVIPEAAAALEGIEVTLLDSVTELRRQVEANDLDAGLVLADGFDEMVRSGEQPPLEFYVGGESLASDRIVLAVTTIDLIRQVEGSPPPVAVEVTTFGTEALPIAVRLVPAIVAYALLVAAVFLPAFGLADERERGTLDAVVVTPVRLSEVVAAKGALGLVLAIPMAVFTLWLNDALGVRWPALLVVIAVGGLLLVEVGMIYGIASKDITGVFALIKGTGILLMGPAIFYMFPNWPQWIAKLFPTYWIIDPIFRVTAEGATLGDVWDELAIALCVVALMLLPLNWMTRRLSRTLGAT
jgi:ABC-2 type transport system permease protein